VIYDISATLLL